MKVKVESNAQEIAQELEDGVTQYKRELKWQMFRALSLLEGQIMQNIRKNAGLQVRTGSLLNSIPASKKVTEINGAVTGEIGPEGVEYAAIHEFGGTILPKKAKNLTIPTEFNRRRDGLPKITVRDLMAMKGQSFIANSAIFKKEGDQITPMFWLKKSVTIPKRPYLFPALKSKEKEILDNFGLFLSMAFGAD